MAKKAKPKKPKKTKSLIAYQKEKRRIQQFIRRAKKRGYSFSEDIIPPKPEKIQAKDVKALKKITPEKLYEQATYTAPETGVKISGTKGRHLERSISARKSAATRKARLENAYADYISETPDIEEIIVDVAKNEIPELNYLDYLDTDFVRETFFRERDDKGTKPEEYQQSYETLNTIRQIIRDWMPDSRWSPWFRKVKENDKNIVERILESAIATEGEDVVAARLEKNAPYVITLVESALYGSKDRDEVNRAINEFAEILKGGALNVDEAREIHDYTEYLETY